MKPFFEKALTEKERVGSRNLSRKWGGRVPADSDDEPGGFIPWGRHRNYDCKRFTDVLGPLRGYLRKNVGRPWDEVYSEICAGMDRRTTTGAHIFTHLWQYVERYTVLIDGEVMALAQYPSRSGYDKVNDWYVHPVTKLLCYKPPERYRGRAKKPADFIAIEEGKEYRIIDGIWYYTEYWWKEWAMYHARWAAFGHNPWKVHQEKVILKKRQLNRRELRELGVRNGNVSEHREKKGLAGAWESRHS